MSNAAPLKPHTEHCCPNGGRVRLGFLFIYLFMYLFIYLFICSSPSRCISSAKSVRPGSVSGGRKGRRAVHGRHARPHARLLRHASRLLLRKALEATDQCAPLQRPIRVWEALRARSPGIRDKASIRKNRPAAEGCVSSALPGPAAGSLADGERWLPERHLPWSFFRWRRAAQACERRRPQAGLPLRHATSPPQKQVRIGGAHTCTARRAPAPSQQRVLSSTSSTALPRMG